MTVLFVGDIHLKSARVLPAVDRAVAMTGTDGVVFLGDVCDDWDVTAREAVAAVRMFADWVAARRAAGLDVTVLAGNHDLPYLARPRSYAAHWFRHEAELFKICWVRIPRLLWAGRNRRSRLVPFGSGCIV